MKHMFSEKSFLKKILLLLLLQQTILCQASTTHESPQIIFLQMPGTSAAQPLGFQSIEDMVMQKVKSSVPIFCAAALLFCGSKILASDIFTGKAKWDYLMNLFKGTKKGILRMMGKDNATLHNNKINNLNETIIQLKTEIDKKNNEIKALRQELANSRQNQESAVNILFDQNKRHSKIPGEESNDDEDENSDNGSIFPPPSTKPRSFWSSVTTIIQAFHYGY